MSKVIQIIIILFCAEKRFDDNDNRHSTVNDLPDETIHAVVSADTTTTGAPHEGNNNIVC